MEKGLKEWRLGNLKNIVSWNPLILLEQQLGMIAYVSEKGVEIQYQALHILQLVHANLFFLVSNVAKVKSETTTHRRTAARS
jgi:hypothetical protein